MTMPTTETELWLEYDRLMRLLAGSHSIAREQELRAELAPIVAALNKLHEINLSTQPESE